MIDGGGGRALQSNRSVTMGAPLITESSPMISLSRAAVALLAATALAGCGPEAPTSATVPNVVGQALDAAKSTLVTAGFATESQDLLRGRNPLLDTDWTVCRQAPGPVPVAAGTTVDLGVVKKAETCPDPASAPTSSATPTPTPTAAAPTTNAALPAVGNPKPRAAPKPAPKPQPAPQPDPAPETNDNDPGGVGTVNPGSFCDPPGTGLSPRGKPMVCTLAADGRNRWKSA
jgi:outer membrane biosynthesis protein TonB